jgi:hypothetical protein
MRGRGPQRDTAKEQLWRDTLRRQQAGGLSIREFCARKRLPESAFYAWRAEIGRRDQEHGQSMAPQRQRPARQGRPRFLSVAVADCQAASAVNIDSAQSSVEIALPSGIVLRLGAGCDRRTLRIVLGVVLRNHEEAPAC